VLKEKVSLPRSNESTGYFFIGKEEGGRRISIMNFLRPFSGRHLDKKKKCLTIDCLVHKEQRKGF